MRSTRLISILVSGCLCIAASTAQEPATQTPATSDVSLLGLMPKHETGALRFLARHPEYDGRGTVVAIFDTGVDPGAPGLRTTSNGQPKIVDLVDATGSGDVEMSSVRKPSNGTVVGLSGRTLKLGADWKIPSGDVRVGMKAGFELYPQELIPRIKEHRRKLFVEQQRLAEIELRRTIDGFDAAASKVPKNELEARLDRLIAAGNSVEDVGPIYECVVFHDGTHWRAAVDTDEDGDFGDEKPLTNFRTERQYATFDDVSLLNFAANIYDEGKTLSLVIDSGSHGTHVAGIVAGYFPAELNRPGQPEWNGVAPGVQIVSVKIGDTYLGGMETPTGLIRAAKAVLDNKCDLINMSFGEPTKSPDKGLVTQLFDELVDRHGVIFCASAGNSGPALSTVGAPGGTTTSIIGIGAYISPEMMAAQYALREKLDETAFTWTSRGPAFDGDLGVNLFAPGAAIASVPRWTLSKSMRMNGTSMASPNCCGNMALVVSGLKAKKLSYSPNSVERAFANTARRLDNTDVFAQGAGLIQTDAAFDALVRDASKFAELIRFDVRVPQLGNARGIYLRERQDVQSPRDFTVQIAPTFRDGVTNDEKVDFQMRCVLESTAEWVSCGEQVTLTSLGQTIAIKVNPTVIAEGVEFAEVLGFDPEHRERGPLFRVPITVAATASVPADEPLSFAETFVPGTIVRRFIAVPDSATWATVRFSLSDDAGTGPTRQFMLHAVQVIPGETSREHEHKSMFTATTARESVVNFPVVAGRSIELAIAQNWSSLGECGLTYDIEFHGLVPADKHVVLAPDEAFRSLDVSTSLHAEHLSPSARLTSYRRQLKPTKSKIKTLSPERDGFSEGRLFRELELTYEFDQSEAGSITPSFGLTDGLLYESEYGGALWTLHDAGGRRIATDDVWPHPVSIGKGRFALKLVVRHFETAKLERLTSLPLTLERPLPGAIALPISGNHVDAVSNGPRLNARWLQPGEVQRLVIGNVTKGQLPGSVLAGDVLVGTITYGADSQRLGASDRPGGFPLSVTVSPVDAPFASPVSGSDKLETYPTATEDPAPKTPEERIARTIRDAKLQLLRTLSIDSDRALFDKLATDILTEHKDFLPVLIAKLHKLDDLKKREERLEEVIAAADAVIAQLKPQDIALALANRVAEGDSDGAKRRSLAESHRSLLIDTLYRKGRAIGHQELPEVLAKKPIADPKAHDALFEQACLELQRWVDTTESSYFLLHIRRTTKKAQYGESLKLLDRHSGSGAPNYWHFEKRRELFEKLDWKHLEDAARRIRLINFPGGEP